MVCVRFFLSLQYMFVLSGDFVFSSVLCNRDTGRNELDVCAGAVL